MIYGLVIDVKTLRMNQFSTAHPFKTRNNCKLCEVKSLVNSTVGAGDAAVSPRKKTGGKIN